MRQHNPMWPHVRDENYHRPSTAIKENRYKVRGADRFSGFAGFGVIEQGTMLASGNEYTITYSSGAWFQPSQDDIATQFRQYITDATIVKVERPLFSGRFAITFVPSVSMTLGNWVEIFNNLWRTMGYGAAAYVSIDEGATSSQAGGAAAEIENVAEGTMQATGKVVGSVAQGAGQVVGSAFKGVTSGLGLPIILGIVGIGGLALYIYSSGSSGHVPFRKNPYHYKRRRK